MAVLERNASKGWTELKLENGFSVGGAPLLDTAAGFLLVKCFSLKEEFTHQGLSPYCSKWKRLPLNSVDIASGPNPL